MSSLLFKLLLMLWCAVTICFSVLAQETITQGKTLLNERQQGIVLITAFTANGDTHRLKTALQGGLQNGPMVNGIKEILIQKYAYYVFPRSLSGLNTLIALLDERMGKGKWDEMSKEAVPLREDGDLHKMGTENQTVIVGRLASRRVYTSAPAIDIFLKEHLFGDIFRQDVLSFKDRELATVSALAVLWYLHNYSYI